MSGFRICSGKGFHIQFDNGYTVSVQFGGGNYCDNYHRLQIGTEGRDGVDVRCADAETAVWGRDGRMLEMDYIEGTGWVGEGGTDAVQPRQSPARVLELMQWAASQEAA